ncbi:MAG: ribosome biogenesis GTP-binding protein YihA/YsxC [Bacteroidales bacterium]|nr:ribosome biogenesis GTP-binding protein YihA/YsxC [Bacteroidales bacterium]
MLIKEKRFLTSSPNIKKCPAPDKPEYAFIGRSNVGKSSLINMLVGKKKLAKISSTPGKTQLINHFIINENWYLVDLPGYGYAKVAKTRREEWEKSINDYILKRESIMCLFLLIDSRLAPQKNDLTFIDFLGSNSIPFVILFTKTDKIKPRQVDQNLENYKNQLKNSWEKIPTFIVTSTVNKKGREEILDFIEETNNLWKK